MVDKIKPPRRRNTRNVGFSEKEYQELMAAAAKAGIYLRQFILLKIRGEI